MPRSVLPAASRRPPAPVSPLPAVHNECVRFVQKGFRVHSFTFTHFRVEGRLDFYPVNKRYHDISFGERGSYAYPEATLIERGIKRTGDPSLTLVNISGLPPLAPGDSYAFVGHEAHVVRADTEDQSEKELDASPDTPIKAAASSRYSASPRSDREEAYRYEQRFYSDHGIAPSRIGVGWNSLRWLAGIILGIIFGLCVAAVSVAADWVINRIF